MQDRKLEQVLDVYFRMSLTRDQKNSRKRRNI